MSWILWVDYGLVWSMLQLKFNSKLALAFVLLGDGILLVNISLRLTLIHHNVNVVIMSLWINWEMFLITGLITWRCIFFLTEDFVMIACDKLALPAPGDWSFYSEINFDHSPHTSYFYIITASPEWSFPNNLFDDDFDLLQDYCLSSNVYCVLI